ncbi:udp-n-acetylglucosamine pyrophosphorylase [Fusarium albosuccineum]|uniref:UDP-N-acetylglucosamine diphosphorylase n=1 Tax=Fusarium albosuccineum TaxID=1237068 RepID=A0A8H4LIY4_9HYPO|nr:udp-n-acetylglucosamine pyrophosphorylase [Fusarium albosuccineum]
MEAIKQALHIGDKGAGAPPEPTAEALNELKEKYTQAGQEHVFTFYDSLSSAERGTLYQQLSGFDPAHINDITKRALNPPKTSDEPDHLEPLPESATASILDSNPDDIAKWYDSGLDLISKGQVAVVLMAGGQGTRLGSSAPKGCYDIGLPSHKSLFQIQGERIAKIQELAAKKSSGGDAIVPWYVMTSGPTRGPTEKFFQENKYFGLNQDNVKIFEQGVLPCISNDGKILLETKGKVAVAPDGNGGLYQALVVSGVLDDMRKRGIQHIHAYCVDNCLVKVADPVFIGFSASLDVDIATKVVRKRNATESVGLILSKNGKPDVVEYSEIDQATAEEADHKQPDVLRFRAANIVNHYYSFRFLDSTPQWAHKLPHHIARKKIPAADLESGETVKPEKPNGIKLEQFVFDVFPLLSLDKFACFEVKREDEFSPLKNAPGTGEDDPDTSKRDIMTQGKRWAEAVGAIVTGDDPNAGIEVSPLISYGGEGLEKIKGNEIRAPAVLERE